MIEAPENNLCAMFGMSSPIINQAIQCDSEQLIYQISSVLIPNICECINNCQTDKFRHIPLVINKLIDIYDEDSIEFLSDHIIPTIIDCYSIEKASNRDSLLGLLISAIESIPKQYKTTIKIEIIQKLSNSPNHHLRILAARILHIICFRKIVINILNILSNDVFPKVRVAAVNSLMRVSITQQDKEAYLEKAIADQNKFVQEAATALILKIAPNNVQLFLDAMNSHQELYNCVIESPHFVEKHGFKPISEVYSRLVEKYPKEGVESMIKISHIIQNDEERQLLFKCAMKMSNCVDFISRLFEFAQKFSDKSIFIPLFNTEGVNQWRLRKILIEQAIIFSQHITDQLVPTAIAFSCDDAAIIRNRSVELWVRIFRVCPQCVQKSLSELMTQSWQQRLIVAKIISIIGMSEQIVDIAQSLCDDEVSNVRYCFANAIKETKYFPEYFNSSTDHDVIKLKQ